MSNGLRRGQMRPGLPRLRSCRDAIRSCPRSLLCCWIHTSNLKPSPPSDDAVAGAEGYYSGLLQRCAHGSWLELGRAAHAALLKSSLIPASLFLHNHLLNMYFKCGDMSSSLHLFDEIPNRNVVSWSAAIGGLVQGGRPSMALSLFVEMKREGVRPNEFTLVSPLNACTLSGDLGLAYQFYAQVIRLGFESNVFLTNAFLMSLVRKRKLAEALELFEKIRDKDVVSWNSMIAGYLQLSYSDVWRFWIRMNREDIRPDEFTFSSVLTGLAATANFGGGLQVHAQLVKYGYGDDICVGNSLVDMYLKNQSLSDGLKAFDDLPQKDVVSWTQMASGCIQCGEPFKALEIVKGMMLVGIRPNRFTLATAFNVCSGLVSIEEGKKAHGLRIKLGDDADTCVDNALVDMYAKCGCMEEAWQVFQSMKERSVISWTTMIMGFAQNGHAWNALKVFDKMMLEHVEPNHITFICVLYACSQGGFIEEGWEYFTSMKRDHRIDPGEDHYACMVNLLGRAGRIAEAEAMIERMPFQPGVLVWQTLLAACRLHGDVKTGKRAAERALSRDKGDPSTYILLSNMFANLRDWKGVGRVRGLMENREVEKIAGCSWIEVMGGALPSLPIAS